MTISKTKKGMDFIVSRFTRLYPAFWTAVAFTFAIVALWGHASLKVTPKQAVVNLTMIPGLLRTPMVDGAYWSLKVELCFYAIMFSLFLLKKLSAIRWILIGWLAVSFGFMFAFRETEAVRIGVFGKSINAREIFNLFLFNYIYLFAIGILFYMRSVAGRFVKIDYLIFALAICHAAFLHELWYPFVVSAFVGVFWLFVNGRLGVVLSRQPFVFFGNISYSLYLLHQNIGYVIISQIYKVVGDANIAVLIALFGVIALAAFVTYAIERPTMNWMRSQYKAFKNRKAHSDAASSKAEPEPAKEA